MNNSIIRVLLILPFRHETRHEAVGDGRTNPNLCEHIVGVLIGGFQIYVQIVERGNEHVDDADGPEIALGVALPVLARIEEGEHTEQQHRQGETCQVEGVVGQRRCEENVAQQHRCAHRDRTPVVELLGGDTGRVEEVHPYHHQTGDIEHIEHQFGPCLAQSEIKYAIEHHTHRQHSCHGGNHDVENLCVFLESCLHKLLVFLCALLYV